jgi:hypothetical protein
MRFFTNKLQFQHGIAEIKLRKKKERYSALLFRSDRFFNHYYKVNIKNGTHRKQMLLIPDRRLLVRGQGTATKSLDIP